jgi:hypothetical protein
MSGTGQRRTHIGLDRARCTGNVRNTMGIDPQHTKRILAAITVTLVVGGCGGGGGSAVSPSPTASTDVEGAELAGVHFDVRRDPG